MKDNTADPIFNESFPTGLIRSDSNIVFEMRDSDSGSSADDRMSTWSGDAEYYLGHRILRGNVTKGNQQNSLSVYTELVNGNEPNGMHSVGISLFYFRVCYVTEKYILFFFHFCLANGNFRFSIEFVSVVATLDIKGQTCEASETYIIVEIDGKQTYKTKAIENNSQSTFAQTYESGYISANATVEIQVWGEGASLSNDVLMSSWSETAEYYSDHGNATANHQRNSAKIRAKRIQQEEKPCRSTSKYCPKIRTKI